MGGLIGVALPFAFFSGLFIFLFLAGGPPFQWFLLVLALIFSLPAVFAIWVWRTIRLGLGEGQRETEKYGRVNRGDLGATESISTDTKKYRNFTFVTSLGFSALEGETGPLVGPQRPLCFACCLWCLVFGWWSFSGFTLNLRAIASNLKGGRTIVIRRISSSP